MTHRAASSAPLANTDRSRAEWVNVIVSAAASKPTVCVPGIEPARVDVMSTALSYPALSNAAFSASAVPEGLSRFVA
jgi:hypothetical protein